MKYSVVMPIKNSHPWQRVMTECAINTLCVTTELDYELIIAEHLTDQFHSFGDKHIRITEPTSPNDELNQGIDAAQGEFVVYTQSDIFTRPGWLEQLQRVFDEIPDAGIATLASADLAGKLPFEMPKNVIIEGVYGPFMMFRNGWKIDAETFPCQFGDTDLVMRVYESGLRSYRNFNVVIQHMNKQTTAGADNDKDFQDARRRFAVKHSKSPLMMFQALLSGQII